MKRLALALAGLAMLVGCQIQNQAPASRTTVATLPQAAGPETVLDDVRLGAGAPLKALGSDVRGRVIDDMQFRAAEAGVQDAAVTVRLATVAELKSQHRFASSYLSDDSQVVLATSEGRFEVADDTGGAAPKMTYGRMMGMFDPVTGETLGLGFVP